MVPHSWVKSPNIFCDFFGDHHLTTPDTHIHPCGPHPSSTRTLFRSRRRYRHHCHCSRLVAAISAIVPSAVVAAVVLVSMEPPLPSLPLPLLVDCCLLFVFTARGSVGKNVIFSNGPNSTFECFNIL